MKKTTKYILLFVAVLVIGVLSTLALNGNMHVFGDNTGAQEKHRRVMHDITEFSKTVENLDREKVIIVGVDTDYAPMTFTDIDNKFTGFDIDLAKSVISSMGKEVIFRPVEWDQMEKMLDNNEIDVVWSGLFITKERNEKLDFSEPYLEESPVVVVYQQSYINSLDDLAGSTVGVQKDTSHKKIIEDFRTSENKRILKVNDNYAQASSVLSGLLSGEIDAAVVDGNVALYYANRTPDTFKILDSTVGKLERVGVGIKKGRTELANEINMALEKVKSTGKYKELTNKWFGS